MFRQHPTEPHEVVEACRRHAASGAFVVAASAQPRLDDAGVSAADIRNVLLTLRDAASASGATGGARTWRIRGKTLDGEPLELLVDVSGARVAVL